jgi:hypothetical protein
LLTILTFPLAIIITFVSQQFIQNSGVEAGQTQKLSGSGCLTNVNKTMSWNKYYIIVADVEKGDITPLLVKLGLDSLKPTKEVKLIETDRPETLYIGFYNHCLVISHPDLAFHFLEKDQTVIEKKFIEYFPHNEIAVLIENGTVGLFGFCIIQNGVKTRMKSGTDGKYYNDFGEMLPEEEESLNDFKLKMDKEEKEELIAEMGQEGFEKWVEFQAAWLVPNIISRRCFGKHLEAINDAGFRLQRYD